MIPSKALTLCLLLLLTFAAVPAHSQVVNADDKVLSLDLDSGTLVRLEKQASAVFVSNPEIADVQIKTPTLIYIFGKSAGETNLFAVDENENILISRRIVVNYNITRLRETLKKLLPGKSIEVTSMDGGIVLSGDVNTGIDAENARQMAAKFVGSEDAVINNLQIVGTNQINLRVRIVEVSRELLKSFGFNWDAVMSPNKFLFGLATGRNIYSSPNFITRSVDPDGKTLGSLFGRIDGRNFDLNGLVDILESENMITVLAEPNLTALSGETADFLAGGEFPVPIGAEDGEVKIEFKPYGVGLAFTPTIIGDNRINMRIRPEVSQLTTQGAIEANNFTIPGISTRRTETTVELGSGQSFAIAGLIQNSGQQDLNKIPGLGDIPILGQLFKSDRFNRRETELVVIATPYLVRPVGAKMAEPTDGMASPTDMDRLLGGKSHRPSDFPVSYQADGEIAGFVME